MSVARTGIRVGLGAAVALTVPARAAAAVGLGVARTGWGSPLAAPVRRPLTAVVEAAEARGARAEPELVAEVRRTADALVAAVLAAPWTRSSVRRAIGSPVARDALDEALHGPLIDDVVRDLTAAATLDRLAAAADREALDAVVARALADPALERLLSRVLDSRFADAATDQVLASEEFERVVAHIASSDEVRAALQRQSESMAGEVADGLRDRTATVDDRLERTARRLLRRRARAVVVADGPGADVQG